MEPDTLAGYAALITAAVGLVGAIGAGIWKLIARADRRREKREALLIPTLRRQLESQERELANLQAIIRWHERVETIKDEIIHTYREQLIRNDIEPDPPELPTYPPRESA